MKSTLTHSDLYLATSYIKMGTEEGKEVDVTDSTVVCGCFWY
jgi:hypothetical protein